MTIYQNDEPGTDPKYELSLRVENMDDLGYPDATTLHAWGSLVGDKMPSQDKIDSIVRERQLLFRKP